MSNWNLNDQLILEPYKGVAPVSNIAEQSSNIAQWFHRQIGGQINHLISSKSETMDLTFDKLFTIVITPQSLDTNKVIHVVLSPEAKEAGYKIEILSSSPNSTVLKLKVHDREYLFKLELPHGGYVPVMNEAKDMIIGISDVVHNLINRALMRFLDDDYQDLDNTSLRIKTKISELINGVTDLSKLRDLDIPRSQNENITIPQAMKLKELINNFINNGSIESYLETNKNNTNSSIYKLFQNISNEQNLSDVATLDVDKIISSIKQTVYSMIDSSNVVNEYKFNELLDILLFFIKDGVLDENPTNTPPSQLTIASLVEEKIRILKADEPLLNIKPYSDIVARENTAERNNILRNADISFDLKLKQLTYNKTEVETGQSQNTTIVSKTITFSELGLNEDVIDKLSTYLKALGGKLNQEFKNLSNLKIKFPEIYQGRVSYPVNVMGSFGAKSVEGVQSFFWSVAEIVLDVEANKIAQMHLAFGSQNTLKVTDLEAHKNSIATFYILNSILTKVYSDLIGQHFYPDLLAEFNYNLVPRADNAVIRFDTEGNPVVSIIDPFHPTETGVENIIYSDLARRYLGLAKTNIFEPSGNSDDFLPRVNPKRSLRALGKGENS